MNTSIKLQKRRVAPTVLISSFLSLACALPSVAIAPPLLLSSYVPPPSSPGPAPDSGSAGPRGCPGVSGDTRLTTLAPHGRQVGQTVSTHPTFAWYVPGSQVFPMEFRLYEYTSDGTLRTLQTIEIPNAAPGLMSFTLPEDQPGLQVGQRYVWQAILICDPYNRASDLYAIAEVDVVSPPATLETSLASTTDPQQRSELYARAGLWYDALGEILTTDPVGLQESWLALLEQLADLEAELPLDPESPQPGETFGNHLRAIIEAERP